jgi:hypothetical protein
VITDLAQHGTATRRSFAIHKLNRRRRSRAEGRPLIETPRGRQQTVVEVRVGRIARGVSDRIAQDRSKAKPDEVVQTPVARLSGRAASRATNAYAVRAAEIVLTH